MNIKEKLKKKKKIYKEEYKNKKLNKSKDNKIILETSADLYKLPISTIKNTKLYDYSGKYFEELYKELLKAEKNGEDLQIVSKISNSPQNSKNKKEIIINKIIFRVVVPFFKNGQELCIIGSINEIGNWNQDKVVKMEYYKEENIWQKELILDINKVFEYKFIILTNGKIKKWENGNNRIFKYSDIKKLIEKNLEDGMAHIEKGSHESFDYDLKKQLLFINCNWQSI